MRTNQLEIARLTQKAFFAIMCLTQSRKQANMSNEAITLYNLIMIISACLTSFWLGAAWQIGREIKQERERAIHRFLGVARNRGV